MSREQIGTREIRVEELTPTQRDFRDALAAALQQISNFDDGKISFYFNLLRGYVNLIHFNPLLLAEAIVILDTVYGGERWTRFPADPATFGRIASELVRPDTEANSIFNRLLEQFWEQNNKGLVRSNDPSPYKFRFRQDVYRVILTLLDRDNLISLSWWKR